MSETQTLGPCTECGTPRDACTAPGYCCDECLHFPPDWDGYEQPEPARPVGGDTREALREAIGIALWKEDPDASVKENPRQAATWPPIAAYERMADAVLALPAVRDALAAQETLRRVEAVAKDYERIAARHDLTDIHRATCRTAADRIRSALAGDS